MKKIKSTKNWVNWEIDIYKNASEKQKARKFISLEKYILTYLNSNPKAKGRKIYSLKFSNNYRNPSSPTINLKVDIEYLFLVPRPRGSASGGDAHAVPTPIPPPPKP